MRIKVLLITVITFVLLAIQVKAQDTNKVEGVVKDEDGMTMPGVHALVKGTTSGTVTDANGKYALHAKEGDILIFSFVGYADKEVTVGTQSVINVVLTTGKALKEVVVTALGITREKESLGYSTQEVKGDVLNKVATPNFVNSISGKAAGVQIKRNTNFGGSTNVVIRGSTSLLGSNQALFVVDGVPISNATNNATTQGTARKGYDYGNVAADINPEDIESINILKGAAASSLYGSRAANGVVVITTKKGARKGLTTRVGKPSIGVTLNTGYSFGIIDASTFPEYQKEYGAGYGPYYSGGYYVRKDLDSNDTYERLVPYGEDASYGLKFDNQPIYQYDAFVPESPNFGKATPWKYPDNDPSTFFETSTSLTTSVSLNKTTETGSYRFSFSRFLETGILPNSELEKSNLSLSATSLLTERLESSSFANFTINQTTGRNSTGYSGNIMSMFRQWWQTNVDLKQQKSLYEATKRNVTWNPKSDTNSSPNYWDNPYYIRNESYQNDKRLRFLGYSSLKYKITDWVEAYARVSMDTFSELQEERLAVGSNPNEFGVGTSLSDGSGVRTDVSSGYARRNIIRSEVNYDLMFLFNKKFTEDLDFSGIAGWNLRNNNYNYVFASTNGGLSVPGVYSLKNSKSSVLAPAERNETIRVAGVYVNGSVGFKNMIYLELSLRNDVSSTLPTANNSYYYPSASLSYVFTEQVKKLTSVISFAKIRANYAQVGNSARFARTADYYNFQPAFGSASRTSPSTSKANSDLKPEITASTEFGLEMNFLKGRVGFDFSYYNSVSSNQIVSLAVPRSTGYSFANVNAGQITNNGMEIALRGTPVKMKDFSWDININWTANRNLVDKLYTDESGNPLENLTLGSLQGGVTINARVGQPYGVIYGTDYTYLNGRKVVDPTNGQYIKTSTTDNVIGDTNPDMLMGVTNTFNYKNLSLSFLVDMSFGGDIFSLDMYYGLATGLYKETAFTNDLGNPVRNTLANGGGFINEGVNPDGSENKTRLRADRFGALGYRRGLPHKAFVYDASYVKLREVSISYRLPNALLQNIFINNVTISAVGSNLWIIYKNLPHADPESGLTAGNIQGYSSGPLPTVRQFGFNLKLQF